MNGDLSLEIGQMRADEVASLVEWAAAEGWNPGLSDVGVAWTVDPEAFVAVRASGELLAGGTIISYDGRFGFMGFFIVRPEHRGEGLGRRLWYYRRDRLIGRLARGASIGMDGVFNMVPFYEAGGFALAYRDLRFEGVARGVPDASVVPLAAVGFDAVEAYDRRHVAAPRAAFLREWFVQAGALGVAVMEHDALVGYGLLRPCRVGFKVGPLFADRPDVAERIVDDLMARVSGQQVQWDIPEPNEAALAMAARRGLRESFGCARMYLGPDPNLPVDRIYGVTSFEFG